MIDHAPGERSPLRMSLRLWTTAEVAEALGVPLSQFRRTAPRLKRDHGFPDFLPGMGHRYDPEAVRAWLDRQRGVSPRTPGAEPDEIADWQAKLDARSANMAGRA